MRQESERAALVDAVLTDALLFSLISAAATLLGGFLALRTGLKNIGLRYLLAFASGLIISIAFFEMIPQANISSLQQNAFALGAGFFLVYLVEKLVMIHACGEKECETHAVGWVSIVGIALESLIDGVAIAAAFLANPALGIVVAAAVIAHELPRGFSTAVIMRSAKLPNVLVWGSVLADAFLTPIGVLIAVFIPLPIETLIAFTAGTFLYIGASDLLPEAHQKFNIQVIACVFLGVVVFFVIETLSAGLL